MWMRPRNSVYESPENDARMASCPSFETCDAPICPLDALSDFRVVRPGDSKCKARKTSRLRLGGTLPRKGLTAREWASTIQFYGSWENYAKAKLESMCLGRSPMQTDMNGVRELGAEGIRYRRTAKEIESVLSRFKPEPSQEIKEMLENDVEGYHKTLKLIARARVIKARKEAPR